jgi:hypothetical protein
MSALGPEAEESYCVMVAGAALLCNGLVFLLPTKGRHQSKRIKNKLTELTIRKTCSVLWRKRH